MVANITANTSGLDAGLASARTGLQNAGTQLAAVQGKAATASAQMATLGTASAKTGSSLLGMAGGLAASVYAIGSLATLAVGGATALYKMSEAGAEIDYTRQKFDRLSESVGTTGDLMLGRLRLATKGTLSDFQLTKQGTDLFQLGLAKTTEEAVRLSSVMTALGMDTGELTLALANQSKRRLDQLGLSLTEFNKNEALFKSKGLNKEDAFTQAFLLTAEQTVEKVGNRADESAGSFDRLSASWDNLKNSFKLSTADTFTNFNNSLAKGIDKLTKFDDATRRYREYLRATGQESKLLTGISSSAVNQFAEVTKDNRPRFQTGGGMVAAPIPDLTDYGNLLKVSTSLTEVTGNYNNKLNQLAEKLIDAPKKFGLTAEQANNLKGSLTGLNSMSERYNTTLMKQLQQLTAIEGSYGKNDSRVREVREAVTQLQASAVDANNEMLIGTLKNAGATDQMQLDFARASGMISNQAYQSATAITKISDALMKGRLSADQAANAVRGVTNGLANINGFNAVGYVDIYITYHGAGAMGYAGPGGNTATTSGALDALRSKTGGGRASGGPVGANEISGITEYGEPEIYNSGGKQYLISGKRGGYVSPMNAQSGGSWQQMHALVSRIPTAEETARALVKALKAA